jgi:predicted phosphodiesterase/ketosteroid isomerase-like protein
VNVLALYDIHGNIDALEAVLADGRASDPDLVVIGGDAVPGPFAGATLTRLDQLDTPVKWIRGNGEREVAAAADNPAAPGHEDLAARTATITAAEIGPDRARGFAELPLTVELDGVLFCHATPRRDDEILTRLSPAERWADALAGIDAALVVGGHTHQQDDRVVEGVRFVNAGSVGLPYEGDGAARWLWIADGVPQPRHTTYDAAGAGARMLAAGWPDERSVKAALIEPVEPIVVTRIFEDAAADATSQPEVQVQNSVIRRWAWAFENDASAFEAVLHPDIEWFPIDENFRRLHGIEAALRNRNEWLDPWEEHRLDVEEVAAEGDSVVLAIHITARGKASGAEADLRFYAHVKLRDDKVAYIHDYKDRAAALRAAGLQE